MLLTLLFTVFSIILEMMGERQLNYCLQHKIHEPIVGADAHIGPWKPEQIDRADVGIGPYGAP